MDEKKMERHTDTNRKKDKHRNKDELGQKKGRT